MQKVAILCVLGIIQSSSSSLVARSTFLTKLVASQILSKSHRQKKTVIFSTVLLYFRDFAIRSLISQFGMRALT